MVADWIIVQHGTPFVRPFAPIKTQLSNYCSIDFAGLFRQEYKSIARSTSLQAEQKTPIPRLSGCNKGWLTGRSVDAIGSRCCATHFRSA
jgi:hypothetical protein